MSEMGVETAVEQIRVDHQLAEAVVRDGAPALSSFDLTTDEADALVGALRLDVEEALGEVTGFAAAPFGSIQLSNLIDVGRQLGGGAFGQAASGWIERPTPGQEQSEF
jgi:hypothetical protein